MTPSKKQDDVVLETQTVEVEVPKGVRDPELVQQITHTVALHLQKWMSVTEAEREASALVEKIEKLATVVS